MSMFKCYDPTVLGKNPTRATRFTIRLLAELNVLSRNLKSNMNHELRLSLKTFPVSLCVSVCLCLSRVSAAPTNLDSQIVTL